MQQFLYFDFRIYAGGRPFLSCLSCEWSQITEFGEGRNYEESGLIDVCCSHPHFTDLRTGGCGSRPRSCATWSAIYLRLSAVPATFAGLGGRLGVYFE